MQGTWCPMFPDWGGNPRHGAAKTLPLSPKQSWGYDTQFGSRETWQHGEEKTEGGQQAGPPQVL